MTDAEKVHAIMVFIFHEGIRAEDGMRAVFSRRWMWNKEADQLDMLEVIQYMDRLEYFNELATVINGIIFDKHERRPAFRPLTGGRHDGIL